MGYFEIAALAVALGADCFSVCLGLGLNAITPRRIAALSLLFGATQGALVASGFEAAGALRAIIHSELWNRVVGRWLQGVDLHLLHDHLHWLLSLGGASVLAALGVNLIWTAFRSLGELPVRVYRGRKGLLLLALSANVDAFTAGVGIGMIDGAAIAVVTLLMVTIGSILAALGLKAGRTLRGFAGRAAQPAGGCILIFLAIRAISGAVTG